MKTYELRMGAGASYGSQTELIQAERFIENDRWWDFMVGDQIVARVDHRSVVLMHVTEGAVDPSMPKVVVG